MTGQSDRSCWICGSPKVRLERMGVSPLSLTPGHFAITDADYGTTLSVYQCGQCGFRFCPETPDVTGYYQQLEDAEYERTRTHRALQAYNLLRKIAHYQPTGSLLDVGAGSGILVEQAQKLGWYAEGIEPSAWLAAQAKSHNVAVTEGFFPDACADKRYDVITLVDVIEHVSNPVGMLKHVAEHLVPGGIGVIVTPDVSSVAACVMGSRWWHYRVAHIGYFNRRTLKLAFAKAGLEPVAWKRPSWHFSLDYVLLRLGAYVPFAKCLAQFAWTHKIVVPLNFFDSLTVVVRKPV